MAPLTLSELRVSGELIVPGDKSISHRALILGALSGGVSRIRGILQSADVQSTAGVLRVLGASIPPLGTAVEIRGGGLHSLRKPAGDLDCGNSGTSARLLSGVVSGSGISARFIGDASLSRRPMRRVKAPLERMGAIVELPSHGGLPMLVRGAPLHDIEWVSEVPSAQVKSCILLAALCAGVEATVRESSRSRDHTERMLAAMGAEVWSNDEAVLLLPATGLQPLEIAVPGDPSSASFFAALAALAARGELMIRHVGVNETRTGFFAALREMGAMVELEDRSLEGGESVADLHVAAGSGLRGVTVGIDAIPTLIDELPLLAAVAAYAEGETRVTGAAELRVKESDRISAVVGNLRALGADADELPDGFVVRGTRPVLRGTVTTHGDHRLAMAFGVLGALPGNEIAIDDRDCVAVSYPGFWTDLARVTG
ncbi:MAG: 3-phosphoshikimate 1-carboxyvinyltransferase [Gemmatimonadales bacterium]|jgi:3-phosphoshikimate 1-carboxyvinyltransferase